MERPETVDACLRCHVMETQYEHWRHAVEQVWSEPSPDWRAAARLLAEIAHASGDEMLRHTAAQGLPILRHASAKRPDRVTLNAARRRLNLVRDALYALNAPRFGRRGVAVKELTREQRYRTMLGLPLDGPLAPAAIHRAFKLAAKIAHPDAGGDGGAFIELAAAREALMHPPRRGE
jgi:hypothetical protein